MNNGGEAADQMVRDAMQFTEVAIKLSALGIKNMLSLTLAFAKENPKMRGQTHLGRLLRENKELLLVPIQSKDVKEFQQHAKQYGVLYAIIKDKNSNGEKVDIMFKAEDVAKLNRIYEQMGYAIPKQLTQKRKNAETRRPQENALPTRGDSHTKRDARSSVRVAIRQMKAQAAAMQRATINVRGAAVTTKEER